MEDYLDQLLVALAGGPPRAVRDQLAEAEAHLHDAVDEGQRRGLSRLDAERDAVTRFGQASLVAALERRRLTPTPGRLLLDTLRVGWWLGAIGAIAVGVSTVVAWS